MSIRYRADAYPFLAYAAVICSWILVAMADPKPLSLGQDYYPPESRRRHEEGVCVVKITVMAQGDVEDPTLTLSTGYPALDEACLAGFRGQHMKPAIRDGKPATITAEMPVVWKLSSPNELPIRIDTTNPPRIGRKYYPPESVRLQEEGICPASGRTGSDCRIVKSTRRRGGRGYDQAMPRP